MVLSFDLGGTLTCLTSEVVTGIEIPAPLSVVADGLGFVYGIVSLVAWGRLLRGE